MGKVCIHDIMVSSGDAVIGNRTHYQVTPGVHAIWIGLVRDEDGGGTRIRAKTLAQSETVIVIAGGILIFLDLALFDFAGRCGLRWHQPAPDAVHAAIEKIWNVSQRDHA